MLRLRTLGGLTIEDETGPLAGAVARKRSLALLALVGLATEQGLSRDRVLAYLWPESDTDRARNNLKQTLFQLRQDLQEDVFARAPGVLRLNPGAISVDACDFQAALARNNPTTAVTLYRGPFLDGFYLPGLAEFEHWVESERTGLAHSYAGALESLASDATRRGDHSGAADWWRRLAAHEPASARYAMGLMRSLDQSGDRVAALEHARIYEELVRGEFEAEPDPEVSELAWQLRGKFARWTTSPVTRPPAANGAAAEPRAPAGPVTPSAERLAERLPPLPSPRPRPALPASLSIARPSRQKRRWRARSYLLLSALVAAFLLAGAWWWGRSREPSGSPDLVAVFPFSYSGAPESRFLASGMVDLLSNGLDGAGRLRSVPPSVYLARSVKDSAIDPDRGRSLARRVGAGLYVMGEIVASRNRVLIEATMYDRARGEAVARSSVEGAPEEIFGLVDRIAANLIASRFGRPAERLSNVAATTTRSLPAFKSYLEGERAYSAGRDLQAIESFQQAVALDSNFALAYYRLSDAADRAGRPDLAQSAADRALHLRQHLGERERRLIEAQYAWRMGNGAEAERLCRSMVTDYPDDVEAWLLLGEVLVHGNPLRGRSSVEARPALQQVLARDPGNGEALIHLARIADLEGKRQEVDTLMQRVLATGQPSDVVETRAFRAFALGDRPGQKRITQLIRADPGRVPAVTALDVAVRADDLKGSERFGSWLAASSQTPDLQSYGHRMLAQAALARGEWRRARQEVAAASQLDSIPSLELWSLFAALDFIPFPRTEIDSARGALQRWDASKESPAPLEHNSAHSGVHPYLKLHRLALLDIRLGDTAAARKLARALDRAGETSSTGRLAHTLAESVLAHLAEAAGQDPAALAHLEKAGWEAAASVFVSEAYDRYCRAELLERVGREDEALGWYGSIAERAAYELVYLAPAELHQAQIYDRRGDRARSVQHYRRFIELWKDADPELQPVVEKARERLAEVQR
jgi:DNA-binding SARP family transcriptional activator/TolB-like protein